jgi:predicted 3-demethylubiquinone-9 3-methyltransferase (glyoxalase superfamily)
MTATEQRIVPHLWYDREAREAAAFYASIFPDSDITYVTTLPGTPSGDCDVVSFRLRGQPFMAISAGPHFTFNPSVSFMVNYDPLHFDPSPSREEDARANLDAAWARLSDGGTVLMPIGEYPFSKRYGWVQDRYGLSWHLILTDPQGEPRPPILPSLLFTGDNCGRAEEAMGLYLSEFRDCRQGRLFRYGADHPPDREGTVMFADFMLENTWFAAMDSAHGHGFTFNEAVSFMVNCDDQDGIDRYWNALSAVPEAEQCGWIKDRFGVSWQIVPKEMDDMMRNGTPEQIERLTRTVLPMKKLDLAALRAAYEGG